MRGAQSRAGFSLLEVVLAAGVVAVGVVTVLGLLATLVGRSGEAGETQTALGLVGVVETELRRRVAVHGFDAVVAEIPAAGPERDHGLEFFVDREGEGIREPGAAAEGDAHFLVEVRRLPRPGNGFVVALSVRVSWPYRLEGEAAGSVVPPTLRRQVSFNVALSR